MKKLVRYFFQGIIYVAPIGVTGYILYFSFIFLDSILNKYINEYLPFSIPGIGILAIFLILAIIGYIGQTIIARPVKRLFSRILDQAPLIKVIYTSVKDLLSAFVGKEKKFTEPVVVKINHISNLEKLGFITEHDLKDLGITGKKVAVYFPHSYNFSGELFIVPVEDVKKLDAPSSDVMKFIVSGGVTNI